MLRRETVYHHTSTLRSNLLWMSGVIEVEGKASPVFHPKIGEINTNARLRRSMTDFPPVAWFTSQIEVPKYLMDVALFTETKITGERKEIKLGAHGRRLQCLICLTD